MSILSKPYDREEYLSFLASKLNLNILRKERPVAEDKFQAMYELGNIETGDDKQLPVYEVRTKPRTKVALNRIGLRNAIMRRVQLTSYDGAIAAFANSQEEKIWRLTFMSIERRNVNWRMKVRETDSRRYTFLLGPGAQTRTPENRLAKLDRLSKLEDIQEAFSVEPLNKEFYKELYGWYKYAGTKTVFPHGSQAQSEKHKNNSLIRLITRMLFIWFLKEKALVNNNLFSYEHIEKMIDCNKPSSYYKAILQNLFFATLNQEVSNRGFEGEAKGERIPYRYGKGSKCELFRIGNEQVKSVFSGIPFLNGGLFECLDLPAPPPTSLVDGFSCDPSNPLVVPNDIFFGKKGLITILGKYQFTVEESTPDDIAVALDPELLGRVFENLLAEENEETRSSARKNTGSFYTPRKIVNGMIDLSLEEYFRTQTALDGKDIDALIDGREDLNLDKKDRLGIIAAIDNLRIIDPAVGTGAFPMGVLQKLVSILGVVDPQNSLYKQQQIENIKAMSDYRSREAARLKVEEIFSEEHQYNNYSRKLGLIQSCLYGVDIQPIAIQICRLRFFISLLVEQKEGANKRGSINILPLPNLEAKFIVADALRLLWSSDQGSLIDDLIAEDLEALRLVREEYFSQRSITSKRKLRKQDNLIRSRIAEKIDRSGLGASSDFSKVDHDIYDQHAVAQWFDPKLMFGIQHKYNIVVGNPPYIQLQRNKGELRAKYAGYKYCVYNARGDVYQLFVERGVQLLEEGGHLCFITSNKWMRSSYGLKLRKFLFNKTKPIKLVDLGEKVFEAAAVDTNILLVEKREKVSKHSVQGFESDGSPNIDLRKCKYKPLEISAEGKVWTMLDPIGQSIRRKVEEIGVPLSQWMDIRKFRGITTGCNPAFVVGVDKYEKFSDEAKREMAAIIKPVVRGKEIKTNYCEVVPRWRLLYIPWGFPLQRKKGGGASREAEKAFKQEYPHTHNYLLQYKECLSKREGAGERYEWYALQRYGATNHTEFERKKIVWQRVADRPKFTCVKEGVYILDSLGVIVGANLEYVLGVLNSSVLNHYIDCTAPDLGQGFIIQPELIGKLPVPPVDMAGGAVEKIALSVRRIMSSSVSEEEREQLKKSIDKLVCKLYGLTAKEEALIKSK